MDAALRSMKSMKLYDKVERIENELRARGLADGAPLRVADLTPFDQYHYHGTAAVDAAIAALAIGPQSRVLEVGAGIGGPARYLAETTGCQVTALEIQPDLHAMGVRLTERCALQRRVRHVCGDILEAPFDGGAFDALVSHLVFLHIPQRARLFTACRAALTPDGRIYVEDFTKRREPAPEQWAALKEKVYCSYLPTLGDYVAQLEEAGFTELAVEDLTESWTAFTAERLESFRAARARHIRVHGPEITAGLEDFYATVAGLYAEGVLGGLRAVAKSP